ncbi:MAG: hypothetical protein ACI8O8_003200, partial [Oleiphilaceae bacterium]
MRELAKGLCILWQSSYASILSDTSSASSTSIPKYLTVLSS